MEQLAWVIAALLLPAFIALLALAGEPWRMLDRPLYGGRLIDREFAPSLGRGFVASVGYAALLGAVVAAGWSRRRVERQVSAVGVGLVSAAVVVLAPLTHAFWLADAVDVSRLSNPTLRRNVIFDLFSMTGPDWAQAAPYVLLSLYAIAALTTVIGLVAFHAKEQTRKRRRHSTGWSIS